MSTGLPWVWGATPEEHARAYPADTLVGASPALMTRATDVAAPVERTWRWLGQLREAPYSYDWLDNLGRRSPRTLTPGAGEVLVGQTMATVLTVVDVEAPHHWTGIVESENPLVERVAGAFAMTYAAEPGPQGPEASRIVVRIAAAAPTPLTRARAAALAWGDLVMIRRQLHVLRDLAEGPSGP